MTEEAGLWSSSGVDKWCLKEARGPFLPSGLGHYIWRRNTWGITKHSRTLVHCWLLVIAWKVWLELLPFCLVPLMVPGRWWYLKSEASVDTTDKWMRDCPWRSVDTFSRALLPKCILPLVWKFCGCPVLLGSTFSSWEGTIGREGGVAGRRRRKKELDKGGCIPPTPAPPLTRLISGSLFLHHGVQDHFDPVGPGTPPPHPSSEHGDGASPARGLLSRVPLAAAPGLLGRAGQRAGIPGRWGPVDALPQVERLLRERDELPAQDAQRPGPSALLRRWGLLRLPGAHPDARRPPAAQLLHLLRRARHAPGRHPGQRRRVAQRAYPTSVPQHHALHRSGGGQVGGGEVQAPGHDGVQRPLRRGAAPGTARRGAQAHAGLRAGARALQRVDSRRAGQLLAGPTGGQRRGEAGRRAA